MIRGLLVALRRLGCEHPTPIDITAISDLARFWFCTSCGSEWTDREQRRR